MIKQHELGPLVGTRANQIWESTRRKSKSVNILDEIERMPDYIGIAKGKIVEGRIADAQFAFVECAAWACYLAGLMTQIRPVKKEVDA